MGARGTIVCRLTAGENSIVAYSIDQSTGEPTPIQHIETQKIHPRTFHIDPSGRLLVAEHNLPVNVRDGDAVKATPAGLSVFRMGDDGKLTFVSCRRISSMRKVYGLARRLAGGAMRPIPWTKQVINIPLRQLAYSVMDLSLSLETQSNLTKDHQEADRPSPRSARAARHCRANGREHAKMAVSLRFRHFSAGGLKMIFSGLL